MRKTATSLKFAILSQALAAIMVPSLAEAQSKIDRLAAQRAALDRGTSRVIVSGTDGSLPDIAGAVNLAGGTLRRSLPIIGAYVADMPNAALNGLANNAHIRHIGLDRVVIGALERTGATIGAIAVRQEFGFDGSGVGVAVIDSGVTPWHDDLSGSGGQRVDRFVDFVNGHDAAYDDNGHGTHVAGIVAGNGMDSNGGRSGIAPNARLIVLKALRADGTGRISDVIAALDYVVANKNALNIRVVNLSVATGVYESYDVDPLTRAALRVVEAGVVVVAAAGNYGRNHNGLRMYGGVTSPGNAPWVLTVGGSSHMGTADRSDDTMAAFSSRGPTAIDRAAKPDLVAPGVGIESLSDRNSAFYTTQAPYLLPGTVPTSYLPYLSQSGTSMSAPVVSGTVALMLQANPSLTPNQVKAILQFTAQVSPSYDPLTEGAGFLNAKGAVDLAIAFAAGTSNRLSPAPDWSGRIIWGNRLVTGGRLTPGANAGRSDVIWGSGTTPDGQPIEWGVTCLTNGCEDGGAAWMTGAYRNVVWGSRCGNENCHEPWAIGLFGTTDEDTVVWGTSDDGDTVVWGTSDGDTVVWGTTDDGDTVVWGTICADPSCVPVIWNQ
jgi:serine protease AprX